MQKEVAKRCDERGNVGPGRCAQYLRDRRLFFHRPY